MNGLAKGRKKTSKSPASNKENDKPAKTVHVDVGGTVYKVSRSLIEAFPDTYLHQLLKTTRSGSSADKAPVFIDRNGDRFQYILDYMRDGEVHLPLSVSKSSVIRDLEYFGFGNFKANDIHDGFESVHAATQIARCEALYQAEVEECHKSILRIQEKLTLLNVAHSCFLSYTKTANAAEIYLGDYSLNLMTLKDDINSAFGNLNKKLFDECLAIHGLKYVSHRSIDLRSNHSIWYYVSLAVLPPSRLNGPLHEPEDNFVAGARPLRGNVYHTTT